MSSAYWYFNGKVGKADSFSLPLNDLGFLRGFGIFDFLRTYHGKPFLLREHAARFMRSAKAMGMHVPVSRPELERIVRQLIEKNAFKDANVRIVLTGGPSADGMTLGPKPTFCIMVDELREPPPERYTKGIALRCCEHERPLATVKTLNYALAIKHQKEMKRKGMLELLFVHDGKVLECNSSNIFLIKGRTLITPKRNILIGTTRNFVIKHARKEYTIVERDVKVSELTRADELFITASNKGIMPVVRIDSTRLGTGKHKGKVGPKTKQLMAQYDQWVAAAQR